MKKIKIMALISAIATAVLLLVFLNTLNTPVEVKKSSVLTAAVTISANTPITLEMIVTTEIPTEAVLAGAITDPAEVIGKVTKAEIYPGEQMLATKLIVPGGNANKTLAYAIEPGMRAITIGVSETSGLAFMITPGNHIDILGAFLLKKDAAGITSTGDGTGASEGEKKSYTELVLENITVLAVDRVLSANGKVNSESPAYTTLTLQVSPEQAMQLSMAQFEGDLKMILRSPLDEKITNLPGITLDDVMNQ